MNLKVVKKADDLVGMWAVLTVAWMVAWMAEHWVVRMDQRLAEKLAA